MSQSLSGKASATVAIAVSFRRRWVHANREGAIHRDPDESDMLAEGRRAVTESIS
jgi:hypothetical protein